MFRQSATKLIKPLSTLTRASRVRCFSSKKLEPLCEHHKALVPPFSEMCKLKGFELKSDCSTFHMLSSGYDCPPPCCCPPPCPKPCPPPCPKPCPKPCPCD